MEPEHVDSINSSSVLESLTRTLLYEGYALYPYHRSAVKNQKPIPFGIVFPEGWHLCNKHGHACMQTQCIVAGNGLLVDVTVRFLHLKKIELFRHAGNAGNFVPADNLNINRKFYQAGWQTIERKIELPGLSISLMQERKATPFHFEQMFEKSDLYNDNGAIEGKQTNSVSEINGVVTIEATPVENISNSFQLTVKITNTTPVENPEATSRDEVLGQSCLSTHIILHTEEGEFISHQSPGEEWVGSIERCHNINTYPVLIDQDNTTLLASPIVLYDYPQISPHSSGDLFDSTEIEEALLLHVALLSDEEKKRIAESDEKLRAMLNKVSNVTPEEMKSFHSHLKDSSNGFNK